MADASLSKEQIERILSQAERTCEIILERTRELEKRLGPCATPPDLRDSESAAAILEEEGS